MPVVHRLKTLPSYFGAVKAGLKTFEVRVNDRGFEVNDILKLLEYHPTRAYTGDEVDVKVIYILEGGEFGIDENTVVMSIELLNEE